MIYINDGKVIINILKKTKKKQENPFTFYIYYDDIGEYQGNKKTYTDFFVYWLIFPKTLNL
jgi:hypothetical protein